jgi:hypothetical protein
MLSKNAKMLPSIWRRLSRKSSQIITFVSRLIHSVVLVHGVPVSSTDPNPIDSSQDVGVKVAGAFLLQMCSIGVVCHVSRLYLVMLVLSCEGYIPWRIPRILHWCMAQSFYSIPNWVDCWHDAIVYIQSGNHWRQAVSIFSFAITHVLMSSLDTTLDTAEQP